MGSDKFNSVPIKFMVHFILKALSWSIKLTKQGLVTHGCIIVE